MPPQVGKAGEGSGQVQYQEPPGLVPAQPREVEKKPIEAKKEAEDPKAAAKTAQGSKGHAAEQKGHKNVQAQVAQRNLQKQIPATQKQPVDATGLKEGEKITAKATTKPDGFHFEFDRSITKEQAGAIIFQEGKVPEHAKLEGSGKNWAVKVPNNAEARQQTVAHFNKREETIKIAERRPTDVFQPDPEITNTWTGGELKTPGTSKPEKERRSDLKNDMGFKITNHYELDQGQRSHNTLGMAGMGYEVGFDKPMSKAQVMDKLFDKEKVNKGGEIRLIPKSKEPSSEWKVELVGVDAAGAFKTDTGHAFSKVGRAFSDANVYGKKSLPNDTPPGIRSHIENRTIPPHAEKLKHPAKDGKDVYVWEQDGYMMYVKTNNKGKDGYYEAEAPTRMPTDKTGQIWMRYYAKELGLPPREAWQTFWQDEVDIARMMVGMVGGAARPISGNANPSAGSGRAGGSMRAAGKPVPSEPVLRPSISEPKVQGRLGGSEAPVSHQTSFKQQPRRGPSGTIIGNAPAPGQRQQSAPAPENANAPGRNGTLPESQNPAGKNIVAGRGKTLPGAIYRTVGKPQANPPEIKWFPKESGTEITPKQVHEINRIDSGRISWSMSKGEHLRQWQHARPGSNEAPPTAFTTRDGRVMVNEEAWVGSGQPPLWGVEVP